MRIDVYCSDSQHPIVPRLRQWVASRDDHRARLVHDKGLLSGGDLLFLVSCSEVFSAEDRRAYGHVLVLHASDLPAGRGWSPHIWTILDGGEQVTVSLLEAIDEVDAGPIWAKRQAHVPEHALYDEINHIVFALELELMDAAVAMVEAGEGGQSQPSEGASYYPRRRPEDSEVDPEKPIRELFNQLRVADPERYPAFFRLLGHEYEIRLRKRTSQDDSHED